MTNLITVSK